MSTKKCPKIIVRKDYDGSINFIYIEIDDGITYDQEKSAMSDNIMINKDINGEVIGLYIICPINDEMKNEIRTLLVNANVNAGDIYSTMMELS